jgi:zinc transport system ATP-binding protein
MNDSRPADALSASPRNLLNPPTIEVFENETRVFSSRGRWLHPLFDLESVIAADERDPQMLEVRDKIVGRAAALLLVYLRIGRVSAGVLSRPAREILVRFAVPFTFEKMVDRIDCRTESLLMDETDPERAYRLLKERAGR